MHHFLLILLFFTVIKDGLWFCTKLLILKFSWGICTFTRCLCHHKIPRTLMCFKYKTAMFCLQTIIKFDVKETCKHPFYFCQEHPEFSRKLLLSQNLATKHTYHILPCIMHTFLPTFFSET